MKRINWSEVNMYPLSAHRLEGSKAIKDYCMGGNAIVTMTSPSKVHYTYYIRAPWQEDKNEFNSDVRFVYCLGNEGKWFYVGGLYKNGTIFRKTKNSTVDVKSPCYKGAEYLTKMMNHDFETAMIIQHEGCCSRCGRRLTDPISIERGIGPTCISLIRKNVEHE